MSHYILLDIFKYYKFNNISCQLISSYLSNRQQYTFKDGNCSNLRNVKHGVPQGSVLGPILFLVYINDLKKSVPRDELITFADDTTLLTGHRELGKIRERVSVTQSAAQDWFVANRLNLNDSKTFHVFFSHRSTYEISNSIAVKFLGVMLDPKLNFGQHIELLSKKLSKNIFAIRSLSKFVPRQSTTDSVS